MTEKEFYSKAVGDAFFCSQKIDEARYFKSVMLGLLIFTALLWGGYFTYCRFSEGRWPNEGGLIPVLVMSGMLYAQSRSKLAVLQAIQSTQPIQASKPEYTNLDI